MELTKITKIKAFTLLLAGMIASAIAQHTLLPDAGKTLDNVAVWTGLALYALAGILLTLGLRLLRDALPPFTVSTRLVPRGKPWVVFWVISLGLSGLVAIYARSATKSEASGYLFAGVWVLSILLMICGVLRDEGWQPPALATCRNWLKTHRPEILFVSALVIAAFAIRIIDIELFPYAFNNDEGHVGSGALCILKGECKHFFMPDWAAQPQLAYLAYAISVSIFGKTAIAIRLISVITGTLAILALYLLTREMFNQRIAWLAALLLATLPVHIHFSRMGVDNIIDSLTTPLMLWLLLRGAKRSSRLSFLAAGILGGLCLYTYPGSLLAPAFGAATLGLFTLRTRGFLRAHAGNLLTLILAAAVITAPVIGYYATHSGDFMARMKKEGILQNGKLQKEMETKGKSAAEIMLQQFSKSTLVYIATGAPLNFFNSPKPYLPPFEAVLAMFGLAYLLWRIKDPRCFILFIWFWTVVILGSTLTGSPPTSQRILMSTPALAIIIALGTSKILEAFPRLHPSTSQWMPRLLLGIMLFIGYSNITYYFQDYRVGHYYEDIRDELTYESRVYTQPLEKKGRVYLMGDPKILYLSFKSFDYFAPTMPKTPLNDISRDSLLKLPYDKDILFIAMPNYKDQLQQLSQSISGGEWHETRRRYQPQYVLFYTYQITRERMAIFSQYAGGYDVFKNGP